MRKIILNLAISIDGFITDENSGFDWIVGDGNNKLNSDNKFSYEKFLETIDIVVMGKNCYDQNFHKDFEGKKVYVATNDNLKQQDNIYFEKDICNTILLESKKEGKNIFIFGGAILADNFIKKNIIDEYMIGIIPIILGKGKKLFLKDNPTINLELKEYFVDNGIIISHYIKRKINS